MRSNCIIFALKRFITRGGYLVLKRSSYGWWLHALWSKDLIEFEEFTTTLKRRRWLPPVWFKGFVSKWRR